MDGMASKVPITSRRIDKEAAQPLWAQICTRVIGSNLKYPTCYGKPLRKSKWKKGLCRDVCSKGVLHKPGIQRLT